jgi:ubiquinone/menaquinone biosynthesis C-methylase UbiE
MTSTPLPKVDWDYTEHASHYDKRADYSYDAIGDLLTAIRCTPKQLVAEIGAGTGKLTKELIRHGLTVAAVEPNDAMREIGTRNTWGKSVSWSVGTGEATGLPANEFYAAFFGSSFNVVNQNSTLSEVKRILRPHGWFACMWNHRDLHDPVQQTIESIIRSFIPSYSYGSRREDPTTTINASGLFSRVNSIERSFTWEMSKPDLIDAWKSHATLKRQSGGDAVFGHIIAQISSYLTSLDEIINVPYTTRIYFAQLAPENSHIPAESRH